MNKEYNLDFPGLFASLGLGEPVREPEPLSGGHLNRVYAVETARGKYAVKAINPQVIARPSARKNYIDSENIARIASKYLPALPANVYGGSALQEFGGQFYLIYDYIDGACLTSGRSVLSHCAEIGRLLAILHTTDFSQLGLTDDYSFVETEYDWRNYLTFGLSQDAEWAGRLAEKLDKLYEWQSRYLAASAKLQAGTVISHGDLEPKNVLWRDGSPLVIDWESAGFVHPAHDLCETALYWAREDLCYNEKKVRALIDAYRQIAPLPNADYTAVADKGFAGIGWLDYSLRRSLGIEAADAAERAMGTEHVFWMLNMLENYEKFIPRLLDIIAT